MQNVKNNGNLTKAISDINECEYQLRIQRNNEVKIVTDNTTSFQKIISLRNERKVEYFTYEPKELRGFRIVLNGLHYLTDTNDIKEELSLLGHEVLYIGNMYHLVSRNPMSSFSIEMK